MDCAICYEPIKEHKLFKVGCCSLDICVDCIKMGSIKECPQCKKSYDWIAKDVDINFKIMILNTKIEIMDDTLRYYKSVYKKETEKRKQLEIKIDDLTKESMIKSKYMDQMSKTIVQLIEEKEEEEETKADLEDVIQRYHLNLI